MDPLRTVADLCGEEGLWHHVDGAYGGFFYMCPELRPLLAGLERADSLTLDPHKGLFLPYGTGALLVRDGDVLHRAHMATGDYMPAVPDEGDDRYDPSQHGPDLSRGFPGLRVWLTVKLYGAARLRAAVAEKRDLALRAAAAIERLPGVACDLFGRTFDEDDRHPPCLRGVPHDQSQVAPLHRQPREIDDERVGRAPSPSAQLVRPTERARADDVSGAPEVGRPTPRLSGLPVDQSEARHRSPRAR